jgi:hypothetical protein
MVWSIFYTGRYANLEAHGSLEVDIAIKLINKIVS